MENHRIRRPVLIIHLILAVLEIIAAIYMLSTDGLSIFRFYTVDSNVLQLFVSLGCLVCFARKRNIPTALTVLQLVSAVCLTVTFLIAAFVLMPQSSFSYYFLDNVAPINHFLGPVLSVAVLMLSEEQIPKKAFIAPAAATLLYGFIALLLNIAGVLKGPYFFLEVYSTPVMTIVMWFIIILLLCAGLTFVYMLLHRFLIKRRSRNSMPDRPG